MIARLAAPEPFSFQKEKVLLGRRIHPIYHAAGMHSQYFITFFLTFA